MPVIKLAEKLSLDYRTIMHHIGILVSNSLISSRSDKYGAMYFLAPRLEAGFNIFEEICSSLHYPSK